MYTMVLLRYLLAVPVSGVAALLAGLLVCGALGSPEAGGDYLAIDFSAAFFGVFAGGLCLPRYFRWLGSLTLLGIGLAFYCLVWAQPVGTDLYSQLNPYPIFQPLLSGGMWAVAIHCLIDLVQAGYRWLDAQPGA